MNKYLELCKKTYYDGHPIISDSQYDELERIYGDQDVGHNVSKSAIPHTQRMYSLQKVFEGEDTPPFTGSGICVTPKMDGAAISLLYGREGNLLLGLTRGDGIKGEDITAKMLAWDQVPNTLDTKGEWKQVTGEVVLPRNILNARNKASGALGLKSVAEFLERKCTFVAYGLTPLHHSGYFASDMSFLAGKGFNTVFDDGLDKFPQDGVVYRLDENRRFEAAGFTSKHPKGAYALKVRTEGIETTLLDVKWQVGKSGKVTPVAILDPIVIEDATITKATLNNVGFIKELDLEIGDKVKVERAGGIIPRIICKA